MRILIVFIKRALNFSLSVGWFLSPDFTTNQSFPALFQIYSVRHFYWFRKPDIHDENNQP